MLCLALFMKVNEKEFVPACLDVVRLSSERILLWGYVRTVALKFENMEALFDITSIEPTMVVIHNKRRYKKT